MLNKKIKYYTAIALIIGTVIGAGVFGIPYAISQSGFFLGLVNLAFVGFIVTVMTLFMGEVVLRTDDTKQFIGLAEKYLGSWGKWLMFLSMTLGIFGALTAYLVGIGQSLFHLLGGSPILYSILFFAFAAPIVYFGLKTVSKVELGLSAILVVIFIVISFLLMPQIKFSNLTYLDFSKIMVPYGVILFATLGYSVIPEVEILLKNQKEKMLSSIIIAMVICLGIYALFSFSSLGVYGNKIAEIATESLTGGLNVLGTTVAILAMATGFLALSLVLKHVLELDLKINPKLAWAVVCFIPFLIVLLISPSFVTTIGLTGTYAGGLTGVLCALMVKQARKKGDSKPNFVVPGGNPLIYLSIVVFIFGMIYQTLLLLRIF